MTYYKKISIVTLLSVIALPTMVPTVSAAPADRQDVRDERQENRQERICENITTRMESLKNRLAERRGKIVDRHQDRIDRLKGGRDERRENLNERRTNRDQEREERYATLEEHAETDAQKQAVETFKRTVEASVDVRQEAVDAALDAFYVGIGDAISDRDTALKTAAEKFEDALNAAIDKVKSDCANSTDPQTIRQNLRTDIKDARDALKNTRQGNTVGDDVKVLAETRRAAVEKAFEDFRTALEDAQAELKKAFGEE